MAQLNKFVRTLKFTSINHLNFFPPKRWYSNRYTLLKSPLDSRVEKLQSHLIYSDYFENKIHRLSYKDMCKLEQRIIRTKQQDKLSEQLAPSISVALKYLNVAQVGGAPREEQAENVTVEDVEESGPIYMPYAAEDKVKFENVNNGTEVNEKDPENKIKTINVKIDNDIDEEENTIDENYQQQYEKLLDQTSNEGDLTKWRDDMRTVPTDWMKDYAILDDKLEDTNQDPWLMQYGTSEPDSKISTVPCGGCGALLHCKDPAIPGYIPSELFIYDRKEELRSVICQRCHFMKYYNVALDVKVSDEDYPKLLSKIKNDKVKLVILTVDLTDFPCSIWPNLQEIIGEDVPIFVVGNKVDLLPQDRRDFFKTVKQRLLQAVVQSGIKRDNIVDVGLISAKTHFGIEEMITSIFNFRRKGNVYIVGCTNVGKSSLFNALLQSDFCSSKAKDLIQRATVAPWPGTTLNLLKFPMTRAAYEKLILRAKRLREESEERYLQRKHLELQYKETRNLEFATLQSRIGTTFKLPPSMVKNNKIVDIFQMSKTEDSQAEVKLMGLNNEKYAKSSWCFDTPGVIYREQILSLLTTEELLLTIPNKIISPRSFVIHNNETLFLAGLGRIDFYDLEGIVRLTVFASEKLPVTICATNKADFLYEELLKTEAFSVPVPVEERLKVWPKLESKEFTTTGIDKATSVGDIILSSAGWVALTPYKDERVSFRVWTPEGRGIHYREPALLEKTIALRGARIQKTPAYKRTRIVFGTH